MSEAESNPKLKVIDQKSRGPNSFVTGKRSVGPKEFELIKCTVWVFYRKIWAKINCFEISVGTLVVYPI